MHDWQWVVKGEHGPTEGGEWVRTHFSLIVSAHINRDDRRDDTSNPKARGNERRARC